MREIASGYGFDHEMDEEAKLWGRRLVDAAWNVTRLLNQSSPKDEP